jgi:GTP cyclohydrolase I
LLRDAGDELDEGEARSGPPPSRVEAAGRDPEGAAREFLLSLGLEVDSEGLRDTPGRMARAYQELFTPAPFTFTSFPNDNQYDELVLARDLPLRAVCEHHLLPFVGVAHVGYLPGERILGLSKLARLVEHVATVPQVQERMTKQIADTLNAELAPRGVGVVIEAEHSCMTLRGIRARGSSTVTSTLTGLLRKDPRSRQEFLSLIPPSRVGRGS